MATPLLSEADQRWLEEQTWLEGVEHYLEIDSTNRRAAECCGHVATPHLVIAESQTAGRGRGAHQWWSGRGCLMFSLVVSSRQLGIPSTSLPLLSLATGLAVAQQLTDYVEPTLVKLKWPNDVYLDSRKVCGILLEMQQTHSVDPQVVVGVGLNVSNRISDAPPELHSIATSLVDHSPVLPTHREILAGLLEQLRIEFDRVANGKLALQARWSQSCYLEGKRIEVQQPNHVWSGQCESIDDQGALLLRNDHGLQRIVSGEVRILDPAW